MIAHFSQRGALAAGCSLLLIAAGCGGADTADNQEAGDQQAAAGDVGDSPNAGERSFRPLDVDSGGSEAGGASATEGEERMNAVLEKMQPLQVMLGQWRGITRRKIGQFNAVEEIEWVWDFKTDPEQPALVMKTSTSPYLKSGRLTYLTDAQKFRFTAVDKEGTERVYEGEFIEGPRDVAGDEDELQRTFKLELTQVDSDGPRELARLVFNQQKNNRYLLEIYHRRGETMRRYDTIASQREGTSFAVSAADDYGERTCIISQGLGTQTVEYKGKTYWVCCSGCAAAFKEDPERWIALAAEREENEADE